MLHTTVICIPKVGKPQQLSSNLPSLGKATEKVSLKRLVDLIEINSPLQDFRRKHGGGYQLHRVVVNIADNMNRHMVAVLLDIQLVLDRVLHYKLIVILTPFRLIRVLQSILSDYLFPTRVGKELSEAQPNAAGVPQGSYPSSFLVTFFSVNIPSHPRVLMSI